MKAWTAMHPSIFTNDSLCVLDKPIESVSKIAYPRSMSNRGVSTLALHRLGVVTDTMATKSSLGRVYVERQVLA